MNQTTHRQNKKLSHSYYINTNTINLNGHPCRTKNCLLFLSIMENEKFDFHHVVEKNSARASSISKPTKSNNGPVNLGPISPRKKKIKKSPKLRGRRRNSRFFGPFAKPFSFPSLSISAAWVICCCTFCISPPTTFPRLSPSSCFSL